MLDKNPVIGGSLNWLGGGEAEKDRLIADLQAQTDVRVMPDWEAKSVFDGSFVIAAKSKQLLRLRAKKVVIATGARSLPAVFINNDLPGVMLTSAAMRLAHYFDLSCGSCAVMLACDETDAIAARTLRGYGVNIAAVFNLCEEQSEWADSLAQDGFAVHSGLSAFSVQGKNSVQSVRAKAGERSLHINCDCVLMNAGRTPITELPAAAGVVFTYNENLHTLSADDKKFTDRCCFSRRRRRMSFAQCRRCRRRSGGNGDKRPPKDAAVLPSNPVYVNAKKHRGMAFIDFDEDLQPKDFDEAIDEGFDDIQLLKRYTTAGMGPAQGKLGNLLVLRHLARRLGKPASAVGQVTARPPATAVTFAQLAGYHLQPLRLSALHRQHKHLSASFMNAGSWHRPAIYRDPEKEAVALRNDAGIIDVSTLGKMLISGDDAPLFLERLYTGKFQKQKIGASRYGLMLDESGIIVDDGVIAKIDDNEFIATTTTASSDNVYRQMLLWKARWQMRVTVINITSAYSAINLSGPRALAILSDLVKEDITDLPHMGVRAVNLKSGVPALLLRTGFVGEKGYEIYLSYGYAPLLWSALLDSAQPCGVEAQRLLRLEKGHIIVGQDTDAMSTPLEADMAWALGKNKEFYLGMRALDMHKKRGLKQKLSGFVINANWRDRINECDLVFNRKGGIAGRVTSVAYSPAINKVIGLAYINPEDAVEGQEINIRANNSAILHATVKKPPFYDPKGERLK